MVTGVKEGEEKLQLTSMMNVLCLTVLILDFKIWILDCRIESKIQNLKLINPQAISQNQCS